MHHCICGLLQTCRDNIADQKMNMRHQRRGAPCTTQLRAAGVVATSIPFSKNSNLLKIHTSRRGTAAVTVRRRRPSRCEPVRYRPRASPRTRRRATRARGPRARRARARTPAPPPRARRVSVSARRGLGRSRCTQSPRARCVREPRHIRDGLAALLPRRVLDRVRARVPHGHEVQPAPGCPTASMTPGTVTPSASLSATFTRSPTTLRYGAAATRKAVGTRTVSGSTPPIECGRPSPPSQRRDMYHVVSEPAIARARRPSARAIMHEQRGAPRAPLVGGEHPQQVDLVADAHDARGGHAGSGQPAQRRAQPR